MVGDVETRVPRARAVCRHNPNDPCCTSCNDIAADERCGPASLDPECALGEYPDIEEPLNLRCFDQKRRFGLDLLYPADRYSKALLSESITGRSGAVHRNPLYAASERYPEPPRLPRTLVYLAGIVGVPWQDIATPESLTNPGILRYKRYQELEWSLVLGDPATGVLPGDPFMHESIDPRSGQNPITLDPITEESSPVPLLMSQPSGAGSWINGHEYTSPARNDLQFACVFPLGSPRDCGDPAFTGGECDCDAKKNASPNNPLCQAPGSAVMGTTQYDAKAYPGLRFLEVLKGYGENSILASVCPKIIDEESQYGGYQPAVAAIVDRLKEAFRGACLPRPLRVNDDGTVACKVVESTHDQGIDCTGPREPLEPELAEAVRKQLQAHGQCGDDGTPTCEEFTLCKLRPLMPGSPEHERCLTSVEDDIGANGYCYVDATLEPKLGNEELVEDCDPTQKRMLRFVRTAVEPVPAEQSSVFIACLGDATP